MFCRRRMPPKGSLLLEAVDGLDLWLRTAVTTSPSFLSRHLNPPLTAVMSPPSECKAITIRKIGQAEITTVPIPRLRDDYMLVRTLAVALNPTDFNAIDGKMGGDDSTLAGCRPGCDYVGIVEEVGPRVTKPFRRGDRVAGVAHGSNQGVPEDGAFAEWIVVKGDLAILVPENVEDVEAATLGIGVTTVVRFLPVKKMARIIYYIYIYIYIYIR